MITLESTGVLCNFDQKYKIKCSIRSYRLEISREKKSFELVETAFVIILESIGVLCNFDQSAKIRCSIHSYQLEISRGKKKFLRKKKIILE